MANYSGTYNFAPSAGSVALTALGRIGVSKTEIVSSHMNTVYEEMNLLQAGWGADGITFWTVQKFQIPLIPGVATYDIDPRVVSLLDVYINNGSQNRLIYGMSRTEFASLANPNEQAFPSVFWWDRLIDSTITLWGVPDNNSTYVLTYYAYLQMQDAEAQQGKQPQIPYFWYDAFVADLSHRLSRHFAPALENQRKMDRDEAYGRCEKQNEISGLYISCGLSGYYR